MKKFAALALVALFSIAFTGSILAESASQSRSEVVKANKKKKKKGAEASCAPSEAKSCGTAAPAGKSCCSKPATSGGTGK
ncbi:MAG: hypothetical protein HQ466_06985 [Cryomorphaceae bacterium]|nr:hypothetical protein [Cryomorphaceae bacterium]